MDNYLNYAYYDDCGNLIAIIHKNTPQETIERYKKKYDEGKYEE